MRLASFRRRTPACMPLLLLLVLLLLPCEDLKPMAETLSGKRTVRRWCFRTDRELSVFSLTRKENFATPLLLHVDFFSRLVPTLLLLLLLLLLIWD